MGEREWWANVYPNEPGRDRVGLRHDSVRECQSYNYGAAFRIHVRLKPEGAPKLYASEAERKQWELPYLEYRAWAHANPAPRTPKIEERT